MPSKPYRGYPNRNAYRNAQARAQGYQSYWHQRQTAAVAREFPNGETQQGKLRDRFIAMSKLNPTQGFRDKFLAGYILIQRKDHRNAGQMTRGMKGASQYRPDNQFPDSIFWYH